MSAARNPGPNAEITATRYRQIRVRKLGTLFPEVARRRPEALDRRQYLAWIEA
jgi:hypothetical protein